MVKEAVDIEVVVVVVVEEEEVVIVVSLRKWRIG